MLNAFSRTQPADRDVVAPTVVFERHVQRLMNISHPMAQEFQCQQLVGFFRGF
jgi:hypothetical protein